MTGSAGGMLVDLKWILGGDEFLPDLNGFIFNNSKFNKTNLYRLSMSSIVDEDCEPVVFLDGDIVVQSDIHELIGVIGEAEFLSVRDHGIARFKGWFKGGVPGWVGAEPDEPYFNAGIFVANMLTWRNESWSRLLLEMFQIHTGEC